MRLTLAQIKSASVTRGPGFGEAVITASLVDGDHYLVDDAAWHDLTRIHAVRPFGLGDAVAVVAEPIARALDATIGTKLVGCGGCARRRDALNRLVPEL